MIDMNKYGLPQTVEEDEINYWRTFLIQSDYEVIKALENGTALDEELRIARQNARTRINELEV